MNISELINTTKCLHYSTDLPVWVMNNDKVIASFPEKIETAFDVLNVNKEIPHYSKTNLNIQITKNKYNENLLIQNITDEICVVVGPFLIEPIEAGTLTNMVRDGIIPFHQKTKMQNYYQNCLIIPDIKLNYIIKFINELYQKRNKNVTSEDEENNVIVNFDDNLFLEQKNEYRKSEFIHASYAIEQEICKTISNGDTIKAKEILKEINQTPHAKLASTLLRSYKNSMICSCSFMTRAAIKGGVNPDEAFTLSDAYINTIENMLTIEELNKFESIMAEGFAEKVKEVKSYNYSPAILSTIFYIDNHLCEDITIDILAKEVGLNSSYLSSLFHKETGVTITEWIKRKRIEEAAHFVLNTNDDIADIAFFYKFCSQSYFVQCFKKVLGVTPGEYRRKNGTIN